MKKILIVIFILVLTAAAWLTYKLNDRPTLEPYADLWLQPMDSASPGLRVTWLGVSTLLIDDGATAIMTDGFFTRPGLIRTAATRLSPDKTLVAATLQKAGIEKLSAIFVVHSHYDHVMDAPEVAQKTGALLIGSESTVNVGRGWGLPESRMAAVDGGEEFQLGKFKINVIKSRHFPHGKGMGDIVAPLVPPARATQYLEGGSYSIHIEHLGRKILIQGSAGFVENALSEYPVDVVFLGIGLLGKKDKAYQQAYWHEMVEVTGAKRIIPIHWDDFFLPLNHPLEPFPALLDEFDESMHFLLSQADKDSVDIRLIPAWQQTNPFSQLE